MSNNELVNTILKERKITDFLEKRGITPVRESNGKLIYHCPIHEGDNEPSFMVYINQGEYQTYHCFGCQSGNDIINLVCAIDNISIKQAIRQLVKGLDIEYSNILDSLINEIINEKEKQEDKSTEKILLEIGFVCRNHLEKYNDEEEIEFFFKIFEKTDYFARIKDNDTLKEMYEILMDKGIPQRINICEKRKEQRILEKVRRKGLKNVWRN